MEQNLNSIQNNKPENKSATNAFLLEQIHLPQNEWSPEFRKLVEETRKETGEHTFRRLKLRAGREAETEQSPEAEWKDGFDWYEKQLGLSEKELRGKRVMDLGCGEGDFIKHLISKGITRDAYGVDIELDSAEKEFEGHFFQQPSEEDLPVKDLDYIVASRSIWHDWKWTNGHIMDVEKVLDKSLSALKKGGEMRIYPIEESAVSNLDDEISKKWEADQQQKWDTLLSDMAKKYGVKWTTEPRNLFVNYEIETIPSPRHVVLQSVLIIQKD